ncbi:MAG: zf-HC2 domain-containing protein [candidate division KSB1 bacterium]|nr:zf-HC2 domain-containing protein [candidate division KSB1 bacterium]MDZ7275938.1 zf-HC2 domain-containing protein [candidate division KSB1 bacterium]MDZ7285780.1 zf-HC2 domain-containing protein [candidate division KSB1 bacterium]MDZ7298812.1 zf-HC2 domain-containing protein [candidate division KSB1 bacterium]MDZ7349677.1 zf-HC2 domain-containing protein [candidate division KSB1 bacterium]
MINKNPHRIDCATASEWLHSMLDEELPEAERRLLLAHLESCENCAAAWHEFKLIERSHTRLDSRLLQPPADYFTRLPGRIMARLESEKMAAPAILELSPRKTRMLWLQKFSGRARYAIALAAAGAAIFLLVRSRGDAPVTTTAPLQNVWRDSLAFAAPKPFQQAPLAEQEVTPPAGGSQPKEEAKTARSAAGSRPATPDPGKWPQGGQPTATAPTGKPVVVDLAAEPGIAAAESSRFARFGERTESRRSAEKGIFSLESESRKAAGSAGQLQETPAARSAQPGDLEITKTAALEAPGDARSLFAQALRQAQEAQDEAARQEVWWKYLQTGPDTAYYNLAAAMLARSLAGTIDSTSSTRRIEQAVRFYHQHEGILAPQLGVELLQRERQRLEGLLNWKKSSEGRNRPQ